MKRLALITLSLVSLITGCASGGHGGNTNNNIIDSLVNASSSSPALSSSSNEASSTSKSNYPVYDKIDIDLTDMSPNLVYSAVYNMVMEPASDVGKIVKVSGPFIPYGDKTYCYPAILIRDATACCGSGLEFLLYGVPRCNIDGGNGYPLYNEEATIVGRFETYLEGPDMYVHLVDAIWLENMEANK